MPRPRFRRSDPWVLLSVAAASFRGSCTLGRMIAAADYLNHAIPERSEIEGGVNRLAAAGLLTASSGLFRLTPRARRLLLGLEARSRLVRRQWDMLERRLADSASPGAPARRWRLDEDRYGKAVREHRLADSPKSGSKRRKAQRAEKGLGQPT